MSVVSVNIELGDGNKSHGSATLKDGPVDETMRDAVAVAMWKAVTGICKPLFTGQLIGGNDIPMNRLLATLVAIHAVENALPINGHTQQAKHIIDRIARISRETVEELLK
jgi:hypothetical protein